MTDNDDSLYKDLIGFLNSDRADLRQAAAEATLATVTKNGADSVGKLVSQGVLPPLCRLVTSPGKTGHDALASLLVMTFSSTSNALVVVSSAPSPDETGPDSSPTGLLEEKMLDANLLGRITDVALSFTDIDNDDERRHVFRAMALMANLTRGERGAAGLILGGVKKLTELEDDNNNNSDHDENNNNINDVAKEVSPSLKLLLARFLSDRYVRTPPPKDPLLLDEDDEEEDVDEEERAPLLDPYLHFSSVLTNITQINAGRHFVTSMHMHRHTSSHDEDPEEKTMTAILPPLLQTLLFQLRNSPSLLRRRSIAATIKNCCFDTDVSKMWLIPLHNNVKLNLKNEVHEEGGQDMVTALLYPLFGPEEIDDEDDRLMLDPMLYSGGPDKVRERDAQTRLHVVETLLLLCASGRRSREVLRMKGTYVVLKYLDYVEENEPVGEKIDECVQFLRRDEEGMQEDESHNLALEMAKERMRVKKELEEYDCVD